MPKLNPPQHKIRTVRVVSPQVDWPDHAGEFWVEDKIAGIDQGWIRPDRYTVGDPDGMTGKRQSLRQCMGRYTCRLFKAKWIGDDWEFLKCLHNAYYQW